MGPHSRRRSFAAVVIAAGVIASLAAQEQGGVSFKSGVELINVTATVTDGEGRFVSGLRKEDFIIYEDGERQEITHFNNERASVSLGIALDTSGSMTSDKMSAARAAINRFVYDLLDPEDELFFMQFSNRPQVVQQWTIDRRAISRAVSRTLPAGGTALYDAVADGVPLADVGRHSKKALLVISDGNDTNSRISVDELRRLIRESEVLVYALGVDGTTTQLRNGPTIQLPVPLPFPMPGGRGRRRQPPIFGGGRRAPTAERVNADALRDITDETGGRTEIIRGFRDLDGATTRLADELSKQYYLGYASPGKKDGRWHEIKVEVKDRRLAVRARRGYIAS
jgi:Ca-activated chloride channel family protein